MLGIGLGLTDIPIFALKNVPQPAYSLNLTSVEQGAIPNGFSFLRASTASYYNSAGVLSYAAINNFVYSEQFDNAAWDKTNCTITPNVAGIPSPAGTITTNLITENTATNAHYISQNAAYLKYNVSIGTTYTVSVYAKSAGGNKRYLAFSGLGLIGSDIVIYYDLENGTASKAGSGIGATYSITSVGNGWYRCVLTFAATAASSCSVCLSNSNNTTSISYTGDGVSGLYIWGTQIEIQSSVSPYLPTTTTINSAPRYTYAYEGGSWVAKGFLSETQSTNMLTYSEQFDNAAWTKTNVTVTADQTVGPNSTNTADRIIETVDTSSHWIAQSGTTVSGTTYTMSVYAKMGGLSNARRYMQLCGGTSTFGTTVYANFDLLTGIVTASNGVASTIQSIGNGWYRCTFTATAIASITSNTIFIVMINSATSARLPNYAGDTNSDLYIWGAQIESGNISTSYIPTTSAQATRSADNMIGNLYTIIPNFNTSEGTMAVLSEVSGNTGAARRLFCIDDDSANNLHHLLISGADYPQAYCVASSVTSADISASNRIPSEKMAYAYRANDFRLCVNGNMATQDTSGSVPTSLSIVRIGVGISGTQQANGTIKSILYYNKSLSDYDLQGITTDASLIDILPNQVVFDLEADKVESYSGTGQTWNNLITSSSGYNFYLGDDATPSSTDPTWNGTAGSNSAYWSFDGGDYFTIPANTTFIKDMSRTDQTDAWFGVLVLSIGSLAAANRLLGTAEGPTRTGILLGAGTDGAINLAQYNGSLSSSTVISPAGSLSAGTYVAIIVSLQKNGTTPSVRTWVNGGAGVSSSPAWNTQTSSTATYPMRLGGVRNTTDALSNGSKMYMAGMGNKFLTDADAARIWSMLKRRYPFLA